ncbi:MAG: hydroxyacid dehydrogenase [Kiloniellales bacterium]|nr:hydroxyacid dehydrogenase [Kiloniellales bacterium]
MPHILIAGRVHPDGLALLEGATGITSDYVEDTGDTAYLRHLPDADALLLRTQPLTAEILATAPRLKIVSRHGVGYDAIDVAALTARGVPLTVVGDVNAQSVAEQTLTLMLAAAKRLIRADGATRAGDWNYRERLEPCELNGKTLLIVGFGRIGRRVARLCQAFEMRVLVHDPFVPAEEIAAAGATAAPDLAEGLKQAQVLTLHLPKTGDAPLIGAAELALLPAEAILVNTARGSLVDEAALMAAVESGRLAAAGLDVYEAEPPPTAAPVLADDRLVLMPHAAGLSRESASRMSVAAMRNILDFFEGRLDSRLVVNAADLELG